MAADESHDDRTQSFVALTIDTMVSHYRIVEKICCAAMLAQRIRGSDMHTVMAAGFAGGIGLCGGACGALGTAIWIIGMNSGKERVGKSGLKNPRAIDAIDRFMKCTGCELECSEIVGRKFENIDDHAGYLRDGGCSEIIEALATK